MGGVKSRTATLLPNGIFKGHAPSRAEYSSAARWVSLNSLRTFTSSLGSDKVSLTPSLVCVMKAKSPINTEGCLKRRYCFDTQFGNVCRLGQCDKIIPTLHVCIKSTVYSN